MVYVKSNDSTRNLSSDLLPPAVCCQDSAPYQDSTRPLSVTDVHKRIVDRTVFIGEEFANFRMVAGDV